MVHRETLHVKENKKQKNKHTKGKFFNTKLLITSIDETAQRYLIWLTVI